MAGERAEYSATADALTLLLQDDSATFSPPMQLAQLAPRFDVAQRIAALAGPLPDTLARFEVLTVPASIGLPASRDGDDLSAGLVADNPARFAVGTTRPRRGATFDVRRAIRDVMADYPRPFRRRAVLDTMLTFRLDGEERTRSVTIGGIAGAVWGMVPR